MPLYGQTFQPYSIYIKQKNVKLFYIQKFRHFSKIKIIYVTFYIQKERHFTLLKYSTGPSFMIASNPFQLGASSTVKSPKRKDDSVWSPKLHGLKPQEVLNPDPLFS